MSLSVSLLPSLLLHTPTGPASVLKGSNIRPPSLKPDRSAGPGKTDLGIFRADISPAHKLRAVGQTMKEPKL